MSWGDKEWRENADKLWQLVIDLKYGRKFLIPWPCTRAQKADGGTASKTTSL